MHRQRSIARSVQLALLGLTVALTVIAAAGVASLYGSRQDYEDRLSDAQRLQAAAGRLLAAGVVEEATLRLTQDAGDRERARVAYLATLAQARRVAANDRQSAADVEQAAAAQDAIRANPGARTAPLAARTPLADLSRRQDQRIATARHKATTDSRRALFVIVIGGGLAFLAALALVGNLAGALRRPLDALVAASRRIASGDFGVHVQEDGPEELRVLARAFNTMAADVESAAARVEAERRRLDVTVRSLGDALITVGPGDVVETTNPRAAELVPEYARGSVMEVTPAPLADALHGEVQVERDGTTLAVTAAELEAGAGVVWTLRDVSERARLERLKSDFVATASHELRSPLTSIKGFVELLLADPALEDRHREFLDIVLASTNRLVELVNDLLDVARLEAGGIEIHRRPTDLPEVVHEVATLLGPRLMGKEQRLDVKIAPGVPRAMVDPSRVRQILTNLLTNAHLYTQRGGRLEVGVGATPAAVTLTVRDTGRGMTREEAAHIFDRFYRGDGDERTKEPGTGLGLTIVKSLVDLHGGTIDVDSAPGAGTTFNVRFPRVGEVTAEGTPARAVLAGKRVLIVDDEVAIARLMAEHLEQYGVHTEIATTGEEALALLRSEHFDAVTLDILMPGMTGFDVLRSVRGDASIAGTPIVVVSVFSGREALSGEWVVAKPFEPEELADALGAAVMAGRVRVLAVGRETVRGRLEEVFRRLGIDHDWVHGAAEAERRCAERFYEVAVVDAGLRDAETTIGKLDLRGRRLRRSVVVFTDGDAGTEGFARLDAEPVALADTGAVVLGLLDPPVVGEVG